MWSPGLQALWSADCFDSERAGPATLRVAEARCPRAGAGLATATLRAVTVRTLSSVRLVAICYVLIQAAIWHAFYLSQPTRLAGPLAAAAWGALAAWLMGRGSPGWRLAGIDAAIVAGLAVAASACVAPAMLGDTSSWLFVTVACQVVTSVWLAPRAVAAPLVAAVVATYWAGAFVFPSAAPGSSATAAGALLAAIAVAAWCGLWMLRQRAARVDGVLAEADREAREQYVARKRSAERREHERMVHDTVLNTLTALGRAGGPGGEDVTSWCRHDVALMERALGGRAGPLAEGQAPDGLLARVEELSAQMRRRGLAVHVACAVRGRAAGAARPGGGRPDLAVPPPVAEALAHAAREALANVAAHAGTGEAWVEVRFGSIAGDSGAGADESGRVRVTVRDEGAGFEPAGVAPARLGVRRSIIERVADCGGGASVWSRPGAGAVVALWWPASGAPDEAAALIDQAAGRNGDLDGAGSPC